MAKKAAAKHRPDPWSVRQWLMFGLGFAGGAFQLFLAAPADGLRVWFCLVLMGFPVVEKGQDMWFTRRDK